MSIKWSNYFNETDPKDYSPLGFYKYRYEQNDFTHSFVKESCKLDNDLTSLMNEGSEEMKKFDTEIKTNLIIYSLSQGEFP